MKFVFYVRWYETYFGCKYFYRLEMRFNILKNDMQIKYKKCWFYEIFVFVEQVSWVRQKDLHIISAADFVYTSDQRFKPKHVENTDEWYLHIEYVQEDDSGVYECQVSTEPKMSLSFYLNVIGKPNIFQSILTFLAHKSRYRV